MHTELSGAETQWLDSISLEDLMTSFRNISKAKAYSQYTGVSFRKDRSEQSRPWVARLQVGGKNRNLGHYATEVEAAEAIDRTLIERDGRCSLAIASCNAN